LRYLWLSGGNEKCWSMLWRTRRLTFEVSRRYSEEEFQPSSALP
jgi:hypothetical protein